MIPKVRCVGNLSKKSTLSRLPKMTVLIALVLAVWLTFPLGKTGFYAALLLPTSSQLDLGLDIAGHRLESWCQFTCDG